MGKLVSYRIERQGGSGNHLPPATIPRRLAKAKLAFLITLGLASSAFGQTPAFDFSKTGPTPLRMEAKEISTSKAVSHNWETYYGSYDRDFARAKTIEVQVGMLGSKPAPAPVEVHIFWLARRLATNETFVFHHESAPANAVGLVPAKLTFTMPTLQSNVTNFNYARQKYVAGSKVAGWVVVLRNGDYVAQLRASTPALDSLVKGKALNTLLAEYEGGGASGASSTTNSTRVR
jgi:hypothetical protein